MLGAVIVGLVSHALFVGFFSGLSKFPGPLLAKFTNFYLVKEYMKGQSHLLYPRLHDRYGPVVRVGPNKLSIADTNAIPVIYGTNDQFAKVGTMPTDCILLF